MILDKLNILRDILIERLPNIKRWENVGIYFHNDRFPKDTVNDVENPPNGFYILWYIETVCAGGHELTFIVLKSHKFKFPY